ncbi:MAG TPA: thioredoxin domain-containing protein [Sphingobium sp.]
MKHTRAIALGVVLALTIPAAAFGAKAVDWANRVVLSSVGGHLTGNPAAPTKVVEYISYTCSHCAHFVADGTEPLKKGWVKPGKVSVEIRNAVRDKYDLTAALLARCGGKDKFLGNHEALFANQSAWMTQLIAYDQQQPKPTEEQAALKEIADKTGLIALMGKRGFTPAQLNACLADPAAMKTVLAMTQDAWGTQKIGGTPSFIVNGKLIDAHDWDGLKAALPAAAK